MLRLSGYLFLLVCALPCMAQTAPSAVAGPALSAPVPEAVAAVRDPAWYSGETTVTSQSASERRGAVARVLAELLVRLSGDRAAAASPIVRKALANAEGLVRSSDYRDAAVPTQAGVPYRETLAVQFDPSAIDALIAAAGLRYWPSERPRPLLWLAIDDGRGPRLVGGQQRNVVKPLAQRGLDRGLRFGLPAGNAIESAAVSKVLALDAGAMQSFTTRYQSDTQVLGKVARVSGGWSGEWLLTQSGTELARWTSTDADPQRVIAEGADGAADALAKRDAITVDSGAPGVKKIEITGLQSAADYTRVMTYLQNLAVVRGLTVEAANPGSVSLQLDLLVGEQGFTALLAGSTTLAESGLSADGQLHYRLLP